MAAASGAVRVKRSETVVPASGSLKVYSLHVYLSVFLYLSTIYIFLFIYASRLKM